VDPAHLDGRAALRWLAAAHDGSDPRGELTDGEGFDDVVISPELEPEHPVDLLAPCREHDDGYVRELADLPSQVPPIAIGKHHIEEDEVWYLAVACFAGDRQRRRHLRGEPLALEALGQRLGDGLLVLNHQDPGLHEADGTAGFERLWAYRVILSSAAMSRGPVDAMRDDYEMRDKDAAEFGAIVDSLVGHRCERTLATNTIKLHFNTEESPGDGQYIWIDPPWFLYEGEREVTTSTDYDDRHFLAWSELFQPLNSTLLEAWQEDDSGGSVFVFRTDTVLSCRTSLSQGSRIPGTSTGMQPRRPLPRPKQTKEQTTLIHSLVAAYRKRKEAARAWEQGNPGPHDTQAYRAEILPSLAGATLPQMILATGLTSGYCWKIRRGERIPHPMYWGALRGVIKGRS
jgi:hypothetical protein